MTRIKNKEEVIERIKEILFAWLPSYVNDNDVAGSVKQLYIANEKDRFHCKEKNVIEKISYIIADDELLINQIREKLSPQ